jgi:hypothetical protein
MTEPSVVIEKKEKPNSWEFGKASNRMKLYFENAEDLKILFESVKSFLQLEF